MKISKLSGVLLVISLLVLAQIACVQVDGTANNNTGGAIEFGAVISVLCDGSYFDGRVQNEGYYFAGSVQKDGYFSFFLPFWIPNHEVSCTFNDLLRPTQYLSTEVYECISSNCSFTIAESAVQEDVSEVMFNYVCSIIHDCDAYCGAKGVCPLGPACTECLDGCESSMCPP
jgi:hypothetical protein